MISLPGEVDTFEFSGAAGQRGLLRLDASAGSTNADAYAAFGAAETPPPGCGIGLELALILPLLARLRSRAR